MAVARFEGICLLVLDTIPLALFRRLLKVLQHQDVVVDGSLFDLTSVLLLLLQLLNFLKVAQETEFIFPRW